MPVGSLFEICILRTAELLKDCYWPVNGFSNSSVDELNPFANLPAHINEELVPAVAQLTTSGTLNVRHLYPVLSSGRLRNFKLENILVSNEEFVAILAALSVHAFYLQKLVLRKIYFVEVPAEKYDSMKSTAIECLLSLSPNLEYLATDKTFDLEVLQKISSLKHLELDFPPKNKLFDLIPKLNDYYFIPNDTLVYFSVFEGFQNHISSEEIAFLLQYCPKLAEITNNVAGALKLLHADDLFSGVLDKRYELERYILGDGFRNTTEGVASVDVVHIATVTCPKTKSLDILVNSHQAISALSDFKNLEALLIQWESPDAGDFRLGLGNTLRNVGSQINDLTIINFSYLDFEAIGQCCPTLKVLKVEFDSDLEVNNSSETAFRDLEILSLQCEGVFGIKGAILQLLLSNCEQLVSLNLDNVRCLTDELLQLLLQKNCLSKLKDASFTYCALTSDGLQRFIESCPMLEFLSFHSVVLSFENAIEIVHQINPRIILTSEL